MDFLRDVDHYFRTKPWLFFSILTVLSLFLITAILLSAICPPAILAICIGGLSLVGAILPLAAIALFTTFMIATFVTQIPRIVYSPYDELVTVIEGLSSTTSAMSQLGENQLKEIAAGNNEHFPRVFSPSVKDEHKESNSNNNSVTVTVNTL